MRSWTSAARTITQNRPAGLQEGPSEHRLASGVLGPPLESPGPSPERVSAALGRGLPLHLDLCSLILYIVQDPKVLSDSGTETSFLPQLLVLGEPQTTGPDVLTDEEKHPKIKGGKTSKGAAQQAGCIMGANVVALGRTHLS